MPVVDQHGNVGVHKFNGKIMGTGGFIDISATSKKIVFCGTLTAGSLKTEITDGKLNIVQEGRVKKFIRELPEITFSGKIALERGLDVRYITERAVFTLKEDGLHLIEIAPGVDEHLVAHAVRAFQSDDAVGRLKEAEFLLCQRVRRMV